MVPPEMSAGYSDQLATRSKETGSNLCVGLDPRIEHHEDDVLEVERFLDQGLGALSWLPARHGDDT